jgi:hypothetical protein
MSYLVRAGPMRGLARGRLARGRRQQAMFGLELFTGVSGLVGGLLLVAKPDGSLMSAKLSALAGSPFSDWRVPGVLLATLVGGGFLGISLWQWQHRAHARELSMLAGLGLIAFEGAELVWIGFQPLEAVFAGVGVAVVTLAWKPPRS